MRNEKWKNDFSPIDTNSDLWVDQQHSKAYLRHLIYIGRDIGRADCQLAQPAFLPVAGNNRKGKNHIG